MSTPPSLHQSSRSSTGALSQQPTLPVNAASTQSSSPNPTSSPATTPSSTPGPSTAQDTAFERAKARRCAAHNNAGGSATAAAIPSTGSASNSGIVQSSNPSASSTTAGFPSSAVTAALKRFKARLRGPQFDSFPNTTIKDLQREMSRIQTDQERGRKMVNMRRIQRCIEAMTQFGQVVEVFLNVSDAVAFIWGPMKLLLMTASTFLESFEILLDAYEQIGEQMPLLGRYEKLFKDDDELKGALELIYIDILDFHGSAASFFQGKVWTRFFRSMWKDFNTKFGGILKNLGRHKIFVENCVQLETLKHEQHRVSNFMHSKQWQEASKLPKDRVPPQRDLKKSMGPGPRNPLHWAAALGVPEQVAFYVQKNEYPVNALTEKSWTAAHLAAREGHTKILKTLMTAPGIDLFIKNREERTPLHIAAVYNRKWAAKVLLERKPKLLEPRDKWKRTAFIIAAESGHAEVLKVLRQFGQDMNETTVNKGWTALHLAAGFGHVETVKWLLENGTKKWTPIRDGPQKGFTAKQIAELKGRTNVLEFL